MFCFKSKFCSIPTGMRAIGGRCRHLLLGRVKTSDLMLPKCATAEVPSPGGLIQIQFCSSLWGCVRALNSTPPPAGCDLGPCKSTEHICLRGCSWLPPPDTSAAPSPPGSPGATAPPTAWHEGLSCHRRRRTSSYPPRCSYLQIPPCTTPNCHAASRPILSKVTCP